jgi:hypothetical protein
MKPIFAALRVVGLLAIATVALAQRHDDAIETRPLDPQQNPPSLSERARGAEASLPVVVQRSIDGDPELRTQRVKVAGNERRNITLSGEVTSQRLKDRAGALAQQVSGVQHVHNDIVVLGSRRSADEASDAATTDGSDPAHVLPRRE